MGTGRGCGLGHSDGDPHGLQLGSALGTTQSRELLSFLVLGVVQDRRPQRIEPLVEVGGLWAEVVELGEQLLAWRSSSTRASAIAWPPATTRHT